MHLPWPFWLSATRGLDLTASSFEAQSDTDTVKDICPLRLMLSSPGNSRYYYYRLLDKTIDQHILSQDYSVRWYSGLLPHFKLGSGAGRWRPALALLFLFLAIHGTLFWWTISVDYQPCAVNLRGGRLGLSKETCDSEETRYAPVSTEASYPTLTTLR